MDVESVDGDAGRHEAVVHVGEDVQFFGCNLNKINTSKLPRLSHRS